MPAIIGNTIPDQDRRLFSLTVKEGELKKQKPNISHRKP